MKRRWRIVIPAVVLLAIGVGYYASTRDGSTAKRN
jgi:hypothetical protein